MNRSVCSRPPWSATLAKPPELRLHSWRPVHRVAELAPLGDNRTHRMKPTILIFGLVAVGVVLVACNRQSTEAMPSSSGAVAFSSSGITLTPGDGWNRIEMAAGPAHCPPTLVGTGGMVQVLVLPTDRSDLQVAVTGLRAAFDANTKAVKDSFKQEKFTTEGGLQGIRVSYSQQSEKDGRVTESRSYNYIVRNLEGRGVGVNYIATAQSDSDAIHQMIRKTLRLK